MVLAVDAFARDERLIEYEDYRLALSFGSDYRLSVGVLLPADRARDYRHCDAVYRVREA